jgi:hypothetical protein
LLRKRHRQRVSARLKPATWMEMHEAAHYPTKGLLEALWTLVGEEESEMQVWGQERTISTVEDKFFDDGNKRDV